MIFLLFNVIMTPFPDFSLCLQEVERPEEVYEITHRVFLDVDVDKQRVGMVPRNIWCFCVQTIILSHYSRHETFDFPSWVVNLSLQ